MVLYLNLRGTWQVGLALDLMELVMASYASFYGILTGLAASTDHPSRP